MPIANDPEVSLRVADVADALCLGVLAQQVFLDTYATGGISAGAGARGAVAVLHPGHGRAVRSP